jgi:hypothetical protein
MKKIDRLCELRNSVYNSEDMIDGEYSVGLYGSKENELDEKHQNVLDVLRDYEKFLEKRINEIQHENNN